eukprot:6211991-Pleurochrysis_carterae.AAC.3
MAGNSAETRQRHGGEMVGKGCQKGDETLGKSAREGRERERRKRQSNGKAVAWKPRPEIWLQDGQWASERRVEACWKKSVLARRESTTRPNAGGSRVAKAAMRVTKAAMRVRKLAMRALKCGRPMRRLGKTDFGRRVLMPGLPASDKRGYSGGSLFQEMERESPLRCVSERLSRASSLPLKQTPQHSGVPTTLRVQGTNQRGRALTYLQPS